MITTPGVVAVQEQLVKLVASPFKIISVVGKIPHTHKKVFETLEHTKSISEYVIIYIHTYWNRNRINPLRNFAFCSRFTGHKTCMYVEGDDPKKLVVVHYAVDRYFDRVWFNKNNSIGLCYFRLNLEFSLVSTHTSPPML